MIVGIAIVVWMSSSTEGFEDVERPNIPLISPRYQTLIKGEIHAFAPPSTTLLAPPPGQSASVNSQPASDPALEKAVTGRIQSVYESLLGFFKADANGLQKLGDPSIQLAFSTARSDMGRVKDEIAVMTRNPGIESNLTSQDLDSIEANIGYLQRKWRMSVNAMSGSPMPPVEGFQSGAERQISPYEDVQNAEEEQISSYEGFQSSGDLGSGSGTGSGSGSDIGSGSGSGSGSGLESSTGSSMGSSMGSSTGSSMGSSTGSDMNLKDLQDLSLAINVEIVRLQSSGSTDLNTQSRINVLSSINQNVSDIINEVTSGIRKLKDVPIKRSDIANFLPAMKNMNTAIPELIQLSGMSSFLNSLFPKFSLGDISGSVIGKAMFDAYGKNFFNNLSWDVGFSYKGQAEQDIARNKASAAADTLAAATSGQSYDDRMAAGAQAAPNTSYSGLMSSLIASQTGMTPTHVSAGMGGVPAATEKNAPGPPSTFDWKERSKQICAQVVARGMDPNDFGCLADPDKMNRESFSWRGYTQMVCDRLNTIYDTSIPFLCGCPPQTWPGWRQ